jgi:sec-independent protein translocase protein TatA
MGGLSPIHWLIIIGVALLLFGGRGKISGLMGDAAKGVKAFRDGLKDEPAADAEKKDAPSAPLPSAEAEKEKAKR